MSPVRFRISFGFAFRCRQPPGMLSSLAAGVLLLALVVGLAGCRGGGQPVGHFTEADAVGAWHSTTETVDTTITLRDDHTFVATGWPLRVNCVPPYASTTDRLHPDQVADLTGTWSLSEAGWSPDMLLSFDRASGCDSSLLPNFSRGQDGHVLMEFYLEGSGDPDVTLPDQIFMLRQERKAPDLPKGPDESVNLG